MRHIFPFFFLIVCLFGTLKVKAKEREHFIDPSLQRGVALLAPRPVKGVGVKIDTLRFCKNQESPIWRLCSWDYGTFFSGNQSSHTEYGIGYANDAFLIARDNEGIITMRVNASNVYKSHRSVSSQPWINFLLETEYDSLILANATKATLSYEMRVLSCRNRMGDAYNTNIHAAQFLAYLYVRNINKESEDYQKSLWLGVGMYDNRCVTGTLDSSITSWDIGTNTYIFNPKGENVFGKKRNLTDHKWHKVTVDIRKIIDEAIHSLNSNGYLKASKVDDYAICYMNIGWEVPGTFDVVGQFRDISITSNAESTEVKPSK